MVKSIRIPDTIPFPPLLNLWEQQEKEGRRNEDIPVLQEFSGGTFHDYEV
ncbi:MAG: hypothetical protein OD814_001240 [Candidatus Alkanophagales archaeon MCA70_species_1]|nr:hypothetical protein [Candidatus Alkanophaga volatiphilum]